jgi:DHA2 family multidrug resistance protein-like MFS transporter
MSVMMQSAPPERAGSVASMSETSGEFGIAVGVAGLGSLATFVYRDQLAPYAAAQPEPVGAAALDSLAGALQAASTLPGQTAHELAAAAQEAFTASFTVVAGVGTSILVGLAAAAWIALRRS